ncbi:MAG: DUF3307 domain-containing protein [Elusimicrobiales bacterium]|jgi:hypothetical protein|nr:DUF3307 domain-containing protein [Elusimicrobiales bacterium]
MDIFWRLVLSHLIADFTLQTDWINRMKREKFLGVIAHIGVHIVVTTALLIPYLNIKWFHFMGMDLKGYLIIIILCCLHFLVDQTRIYITKNDIYPDNTLFFLVDQLFHFYFIFLFTPFSNVSANFLGEKIVVILTFLVLITHTTTVLIYYIEKDIKNLPFPTFDQKYFMIFERTVIWGLFLLKGKWWLAILIIWIYQLYYLKKKKLMDISDINFYLSVSVSIVFGILSRYCLYSI